MCGIFLVPDSVKHIVRHAHERGPDTYKSVTVADYQFGFSRLAVVAGDSAEQPFCTPLFGVPDYLVQITNAEIYNHVQLRQSLADAWNDVPSASDVSARVDAVIGKGAGFGSSITQLAEDCMAAHLGHNLALDDIGAEADCDIIGKLVVARGPATAFALLHGVFACALRVGRHIVLARDRYGVRPLFYGHLASTGQLVAMSVTSQLLARDEVRDLRPFPPGHWLVYNLYTGEETLHRFEPMHNPTRLSLVSSFYEACRVRCLQQTMTVKGSTPERPTLVLLSGGTDSSAVLGMAVHFLGADNVQAVTTCFTDTLDCTLASGLCAELGVASHTVISIGVDHARQHLKDCIRTLGTYDVTTVRAGLAQYVTLQILKQQQLQELPHVQPRVVLCGEGADELAQGYQYFKAAPSAEDADTESCRLLDEIYLYDGLRVDRTTGSVGLEVRLPFLDTHFVHEYLAMPPDQRFDPVIEKRALRDFLAGPMAKVVPELRGETMQAILRRPKEAYSDSVGSGWVDALKAWADEAVPDVVMANAAIAFPFNTPATKEAYLYRSVFEAEHGFPGHIPHMWMPKWCDGVTDPSATVLPCYAV